MKIFKFLMIVGIIGVTFTVLFPITKKEDQRQTSPRSLHYLQMVHAFSDPRGNNLAGIVQILNDGNKDQQLQIKKLDRESLNKQIEESSNDDLPELFFCQAGFNTQRLIDLGKVQPIDGFWQSFSLAEHFTSPNSNAASTYNNRKYLIPISRSVVVFFYNKELLKTERLHAPKSWEELIQLAEELKARNFIPFALGAKEQWPAQYWFDYLLLRTAGREYRQKLMQNNASYTDPEVKRAFAMFGSLLQQGLFNADANELDQQQAANTLCSGEAAMMLSDSAVLEILSSTKCHLTEKDNLDFFPFPPINPKVEKATIGTIEGMVVAQKPASQSYLDTVLSQFSKPEIQQKLNEKTSFFPGNDDISRANGSPFIQRIQNEIVSAQSWAVPYTMATTPEISEKGLESINKLIAMPTQHRQILEQLQTELKLVGKAQ